MEVQVTQRGRNVLVFRLFFPPLESEHFCDSILDSLQLRTVVAIQQQYRVNPESYNTTEDLL